MEAKVETAAGQLHYRVDGPASAPPVLLSNSLGSTLELWDAQVEAWKDRFRVIRYDTRGHGRSSAPKGEYTLADLGDDAVRVLDAVGVEAAHVCGISLGGLTALWLGVHRPARVRSLIVANSAPRVGTPERWIDRAAKVRAEGMTAIPDLVLPTWFTAPFRERQPATIERFRQMAASANPEGYIGCCAALRDADLREELQRISARTLVVAGAQDQTTTVADAEAIRAAIPGASLVTLPCAHLSNVECDDRFAAQVASFVDAASGDGMRRRILGSAHVDRARAAATPMSSEFQDFITRYVWGEIWTRPGLDERTRRVLVLGTMIALGRWEEFALHVGAAVREGGFTADDIREVILQQAVYCGVPAANHALKVAGDVLSSR